jgi:hypothetical protein
LVIQIHPVHSSLLLGAFFFLVPARHYSRQNVSDRRIPTLQKRPGTSRSRPNVGLWLPVESGHQAAEAFFRHSESLLPDATTSGDGEGGLASISFVRKSRRDRTFSRYIAVGLAVACMRFKPHASCWRAILVGGSNAERYRNVTSTEIIDRRLLAQGWLCPLALDAWLERRHHDPHHMHARTITLLFPADLSRRASSGCEIPMDLSEHVFCFEQPV